MKKLFIYILGLLTAIGLAYAGFEVINDLTVQGGAVVYGTIEDGSGLIYKTSPQLFMTGPVDVTSSQAYSVTHNLGVTQADVEAGRYTVRFTFFYNGKSIENEALATNAYYFSSDLRTGSTGATSTTIYRQTDDLEYYANDTVTAVRVHIIDNWLF